MYNVIFYRDKNGKEPVLEYLKKLSLRNDKDSRIKLNKINDYIEALSQYGTKIGEPYVKYLGNCIWELRPIKDRIFFASWHNKTFILLHHFTKKTKKTPKRELQKAIRAFADFKERSKQ